VTTGTVRRANLPSNYHQQTNAVTNVPGGCAGKGWHEWKDICKNGTSRTCRSHGNFLKPISNWRSHCTDRFGCRMLWKKSWVLKSQDSCRSKVWSCWTFVPQLSWRLEVASSATRAYTSGPSTCNQTNHYVKVCGYQNAINGGEQFFYPLWLFPIRQNDMFAPPQPSSPLFALLCHFSSCSSNSMSTYMSKGSQKLDGLRTLCHELGTRTRLTLNKPYLPINGLPCQIWQLCIIKQQ